MKRHIFLALSLFCFLLSGLCLFSIKRGQDEILASRISPQVLRFHVLANSDSRQDQQLKMEVKSLIVDQISREMSGCRSKDEMCSYLLENSARLTGLAASYIRSQGLSYPVSLQICQDYFPAKIYGDIEFPCGTYDAARLVIGKGEGHNWWCVLYPSLCFIQPSYAVLPSSSQAALRSSVGDSDYEKMQVQERPSVHVRFKILELLQDL